MPALTPGLAVAPHAGYAALGVILKAYDRHPRADDLARRIGLAGRKADSTLDETWYLVRWEEGKRNLVYHSELRPYPIEEE